MKSKLVGAAQTTLMLLTMCAFALSFGVSTAIAIGAGCALFSLLSLLPWNICWAYGIVAVCGCPALAVGVFLQVLIIEFGKDAYDYLDRRISDLDN